MCVFPPFLSFPPSPPCIPKYKCVKNFKLTLWLRYSHPHTNTHTRALPFLFIPLHATTLSQLSKSTHTEWKWTLQWRILSSLPFHPLLHSRAYPHIQLQKKNHGRNYSIYVNTHITLACTNIINFSPMTFPLSFLPYGTASTLLSLP